MNNQNYIESAKKFAKDKFSEAGLNNHFLEVYNIMLNEFGINDQEVLSAGILHDVLEDTEATYSELSKTFSKKVADYVTEVSHPKNYNREQKLQYYEKIKTISDSGKLIKMADFTSHLRNFIEIYKRNEQNLYPKFVNNDRYITSIRDFLDNCPKSDPKQTVFLLTKVLEKYL